MAVNLNGYELTEEQDASMCSEDRNASWEAWLPHWKSVSDLADDAYLSLIPHDFLHRISEDMLGLSESRKRIEQYRRWDEEQGCSIGAESELYECTPVGIAHRIPSCNVKKLSDEAYRDVHAAAAKAIMLSMMECERVLDDVGNLREDDSGMPAVRLKALLDKVHAQLSWFFDFYRGERAKAGVPHRLRPNLTSDQRIGVRLGTIRF